MFIKLIQYWDLPSGRFWEFLGGSWRFLDGFFDLFSSLEILSYLVDLIEGIILFSVIISLHFLAEDL